MPEYFFTYGGWVGSAIVVLMWFGFRAVKFWRAERERREHQQELRERINERHGRGSPEAIVEALEDLQSSVQPPIIRRNVDAGDEWLRIPPDVRLQSGDPIEYDGKNYWITDIRQDFSPAGHFTYVKVKPLERSVPRSRYERLASDDDPW